MQEAPVGGERASGSPAGEVPTTELPADMPVAEAGLPEGSSLYDFHQKVARVYGAQRACVRPFAASLGLGVGQPRVLSCVAALGTTTQSEIAKFFAMDPAAVSRQLASLKAGGFVTIEPCPGNRRANSVRLTERGHAAIRAWDEHCARVEAGMLAGFSPEERTQFGDYLDRALANLRAVADQPDPGEPYCPERTRTSTAPASSDDRTVRDVPADVSLSASTSSTPAHKEPHHA